MEYKHKYLKYKNKYSDLKTQVGSNQEKKIKIKINKKYPGLDNPTSTFIDSLQDSKPISTLPISEARAILDSVTISNSQFDVDIQNIIIPNNISITIMKPKSKPKSSATKLSAMMYFHGGGWVLGNINTHDRLIREIVIRANIAVIFVNYTLAPEARYPTQINQAYEASLYIYQNSTYYDLDPNLIIMGDSVGGNMAIAVALKNKKLNGFKIKYLILAYPVTSSKMGTNSYKKFANGPWLTLQSMHWFFDQYLTPDTDRSDELISPLDANDSSFEGFPPSLIIVDENDVLRDEGEAFAHKLMDLGIEVKAIRALGICHDFLIQRPRIYAYSPKFNRSNYCIRL